MKTIAELKMSEESQRVIFWWNIQLLIDILISFQNGICDSWEEYLTNY